ncbi:MAG TPA: fumarylacetoacetate hydrolase family protein [Terracidiphilus sp.]|jgi:2-keto-4-pentenoate hydratase/2-oxohepta-3-ene-1,7-dioic acid hydratase in catechol pathway|nr:fumarylacetoacetate hydrolase family protein [Terracidiphilus sp.]
MKLVSFSAADGKVRPGSWQVDRNVIVDLSDAGYTDALDVIARDGPSLEQPGAHRGYRLDDVSLHAPLANPPRVFAIGLNYRDHAKESGMEIPKVPVVFFKLTTSIIGPGEKIILPKNSTQPDYEAELAFVIGKGGYRIPASDWKKHVYGYTIVNDVSARDVQFATSQWSMSKSFPTFCPMGPAIVTADEIADPHKLAIGLSIDGEVMQNSNTSELVFGIPQLVEYLSSISPLLPGDVISTGTPPGVGLGRTPKRWLKAGESVTVTVQGLGALTNPVVAE